MTCRSWSMTNRTGSCLFVSPHSCLELLGSTDCFQSRFWGEDEAGGAKGEDLKVSVIRQAEQKEQKHVTQAATSLKVTQRKH